MATDIEALLGDEAESLLTHTCKGITADELTLPGPDYIDRVFLATDRPIPVVRNLATVYNTAAWEGPGTCRSSPSTRASSTRPRPASPRTPPTSTRPTSASWPSTADCKAIATTLGGLGDRRPALRPQDPVHRQAQPQRVPPLPEHSSTRSCSARPARRPTSAPSGSGATIYFGSEQSRPPDPGGARAPSPRPTTSGCSPCCGATCATRPSRPKDADYHLSADLTGQANHIGVTIEADIIKQKQPENNGGYNALKFGKTDPLVYEQLTTDNPIDLTRWQVVNCYAGRIGLINSGGESKGADDLAQAVRTAVINKRAGGTGLIVGRKAFQRPMAEGVELLHAVQDVFLDASVTIA